MLQNTTFSELTGVPSSSLSHESNIVVISLNVSDLFVCVSGFDLGEDRTEVSVADVSLRCRNLAISYLLRLHFKGV